MTPPSAKRAATVGSMTGAKSWASSPGVRASMQSNRGRDTGPELALRRILHRRGLRYYVNRRPVKTIRRTADIVFPRRRVAVFVDGCFWHGCPLHHTVAKTNADFWATKVRANMDRDRNTDATLRREGWTVLRIWEHVPSDEAANLVIAVLNTVAKADGNSSTQI